MPKISNDEVVRQIRESRKRKIQKCSARAAAKIAEIAVRGSKAMSKPTVTQISEMIAEEFNELVG
jgi:hypothetical protein